MIYSIIARINAVDIYFVALINPVGVAVNLVVVVNAGAVGEANRYLDGNVEIGGADDDVEMGEVDEVVGMGEEDEDVEMVYVGEEADVVGMGEDDEDVEMVYVGEEADAGADATVD